jgi:hypothetical protein
MLERLLELIAGEKTATSGSLARQLEVSPALVEAMLADLARAGYIQQVESCDAGVCGSCGGKAACSPRVKAWVRSAPKAKA